MNKSVTFLFVIYVNKVVLLFGFFLMDSSRAQVWLNLREGDRPSQRAEPQHTMGSSRVRGYATALSDVLLSRGRWLHEEYGAQLQGQLFKDLAPAY